MGSVLIVVSSCALACGRKGPPLPPLIKIPAAPADFTAVRRGGAVDLTFTVPGANTDGSRPANVERVDVYAFTGPAQLNDAELVKSASRVGSVNVKAPRDPDAAVEADEPEGDIEPPEGRGVDQGAAAHVTEALTAASLAPLEIAAKGRRSPSTPERPLLGPQAPVVRTYAAIAIGKRGRRSPASKRVGIPLMPPPPPPSTATITYDETAITITWMPPEAVSAPAAEGTDADRAVLPARAIGWSSPSIAYNVYEPAPDDQTAETRLTKSPVTQTVFTDTRMTWGAERCYVVRTVETIDDLHIESDALPPACTTLVDTFPPAAPKGLQAVAGEASINLIWEPNGEKDLAGYVVLRGAPGGELERITPAPIVDAFFNDHVTAGQRYVYAVEAVDKAGNISQPSNRAEETAR